MTHHSPGHGHGCHKSSLLNLNPFVKFLFSSSWLLCIKWHGWCCVSGGIVSRHSSGLNQGQASSLLSLSRLLSSWPYDLWPIRGQHSRGMTNQMGPLHIFLTNILRWNRQCVGLRRQVRSGVVTSLANPSWDLNALALTFLQLKNNKRLLGHQHQNPEPEIETFLRICFEDVFQEYRETWMTSQVLY